MKKSLIITLLVIIVIAILAIAGFFMYNYFYAQNIQNIADWKIYKNDKLSFEIKYPNNFSLEDATPGQTIFLRNKNKNDDVKLVFLGNNENIIGPSNSLSFNETTSYIKDESQVKDGYFFFIRVLNQSTDSITYETTDRGGATYNDMLLNGITPIIRTIIKNGDGSLMLETIGNEKPGTVMGKLLQKDYSYFSALESLHSQMLSTFKFTK